MNQLQQRQIQLYQALLYNSQQIIHARNAEITTANQLETAQQNLQTWRQQQIDVFGQVPEDPFTITVLVNLRHQINRAKDRYDGASMVTHTYRDRQQTLFNQYMETFPPPWPQNPAHPRPPRPPTPEIGFGRK